MFCNKCGAENPDDSGFCQKCGAPMGSSGAAGPGTSKVSAPSLGGISDMVKGLPIGTILIFGAILALVLALVTGIMAAAGGGAFGDDADGAWKASLFFEHMVTGILVCGVLAGLAVLSKSDLPGMFKAWPVGTILIFGAVLALVLALLTGILAAAGAPDYYEGSYTGSLFFEHAVTGILVFGVLGGLSLLISKGQE